MRTISAAALARRYAESQRVAWLLELNLGDWRWRASTLAVVTEAADWPARIAAVERWREELPATTIPTGRVRGRAEVRVLDLPEADDSLRARLEVAPPLGIEATLRLAWLGDGAASLADGAVMLRGRVVAWGIEAAGVRLELIDELAVLEQRRLGRLLRPSMLGGETSPLSGKPLPWVFGRHERLVLAPLRPGVTTRLARAVAADETLIPVASLDGFLPVGTAQIGVETVHYLALDEAAQTIGTAATPAARGRGAQDYAKGTPVRQIPIQGFQWLVADHPCQSIEAVWADGVPLDPAQWSAVLVQLGDQTAQAIRMAQWPLNSDGDWADEISATVRGLADGADLVENPARVIERLLTDARLGALGADRLDATAFDNAAATLETRGYRFARRTTGNETLGELLEGAAREAGLWLTCGDPIAPIVAQPSPHPADAGETLDGLRALEPAAPARVSAPELWLPPDSLELVGAVKHADGSKPAYRFPPEAESGGAIPLRIELDWLDLNAGAAGDLGEFYWAQLAAPPLGHEQAYPIGAALLRAGETVVLADPALGVSLAPVWVWAVEAACGGRARLKLRGPWAGAFAWQGDAQTTVRRVAFGENLLAIFEGWPVARLNRAGALRLAGRLTERATLPALAFNQPIAIQDGRLYLNVGADGLYRPFLRIDTDGNAELAGTVRERSTLDMQTEGSSVGAATGRFWMSPDAATGALEWRADESILHLKSILIESVRL